jgi:hypothetical protein
VYIKALDVLFKSISPFYFLKRYLQHLLEVEVTGGRQLRPKPNPSFLNAAQGSAIGAFIGLHGQKYICEKRSRERESWKRWQ